MQMRFILTADPHPPRGPPSSKVADTISVSRVMTSSDSGTNEQITSIGSKFSFAAPNGRAANDECQAACVISALRYPFYPVGTMLTVPRAEPPSPRLRAFDPFDAAQAGGLRRSTPRSTQIHHARRYLSTFPTAGSEGRREIARRCGIAQQGRMPRRDLVYVDDLLARRFRLSVDGGTDGGHPIRGIRAAHCALDIGWLARAPASSGRGEVRH
ncbi:hypothetical protein B0H17DRAFT_563203 [Mycena rosella]|uniref:Uncharacterized protein n=1 Tax=Mycena rosella TaxID=1033263 RepID=A0AAD7BPL0_MYCRO|nr:hypothetical protein B0H17DRAFT_563203 [Mycena rosella]